MNIDLKNCDCIDLLRSLNEKTIDLLITDPPFGISYQSGSRAEKYDKIANDDNLDWLPDWLTEIKRVMKDDSHLYIFCSWHKIDVFKQEIEKHWKIKNVLVWAKNGGGMGDLSGGYGGSHEFIIFVNNGKDLNGKRDKDVIDKAYRTGNVHHPTEKPVELSKWILSKSSKKGDLILDCFVGGGFVPIACADTGRNFIGSELNETYYNTAIKRIEQTISSPTMDFGE